MGRGGSGRKRGIKKRRGREVTAEWLKRNRGSVEELREVVKDALVSLQVDAVEIFEKVLRGEVDLAPEALVKYQLRAARTVLEFSMPKQTEQNIVTKIEVHANFPLEEGESMKEIEGDVIDVGVDDRKGLGDGDSEG